MIDSKVQATANASTNNGELNKLLGFYCWQLKLQTMADLVAWKKAHGATRCTPAELCDLMAKAYNGAEYGEV